MSCDTCPFACTDASDQAQNYGCLPTPHEILQMKRERGINWSCHDNERSLCAGFAVEARNQDLNVKTGELGSYRLWYHTGSAIPAAPVASLID